MPHTFVYTWTHVVQLTPCLLSSSFKGVRLHFFPSMQLYHLQKTKTAAGFTCTGICSSESIPIVKSESADYLYPELSTQPFHVSKVIHMSLYDVSSKQSCTLLPESDEKVNSSLAHWLWRWVINVLYTLWIWRHWRGCTMAERVMLPPYSSRFDPKLRVLYVSMWISSQFSDFTPPPRPMALGLNCC